MNRVNAQITEKSSTGVGHDVFTDGFWIEDIKKAKDQILHIHRRAIDIKILDAIEHEKIILPYQKNGKYFVCAGSEAFVNKKQSEISGDGVIEQIGNLFALYY